MDSSTPNSQAQADPDAADPAFPSSYEAALAELEAWVVRMESGQLPLDQLLSAYQRGAALLAYCRERLSTVENQFRLLDGSSLTRPGERAGA
jgi:exodeoxyribonuclease VII small subunit